MTVTEVTGVTGTGREAFANLLKTVYGPLWQLHVHTKVVIWSLIAKPKGRMGGKATLSAVVNQIPQSSGVAALEDYNLPAPDSVAAFQPEMTQRDLYLRLRWTGQAERAASGGDKEAWAKPMSLEVQYARLQFQLNVARMAYVGPYNILAKLSAYAGATDIATLYGRNTRTSAAASFWNFGPHYLRVNMRVSHTATVSGVPVDTTTKGTLNSHYPTAIDADVTTPTATMDSAPTTDPLADEFYIPYMSRADTGEAGATDANRESLMAGFNGLANMITDTNLYSMLYALDRSSYTTLDGKRITNAGVNRAFSERLVSVLVDRVNDEGVGSEPDKLLCHRSIRREVVKENRNLRQFPVIQTESGYGALTYAAGDNRLPYIVDRDCMPGLVWALDTKQFGWLTNSNMGPLASGDRRFVVDKDAHELVMHMSGNMLTTAPFCHGSLEDVAYDVADLT